MRISAPFVSLALLVPLYSSSLHADTIESQDYRIEVNTVAEGLNHPWSLVFLPNGDMLVTERNGGLKRLSPSGEITAIDGLPDDLVYRGQGGLLGLALSPDFAESGTLYLSYAQGGEWNRAGTAVVSAKLSGNKLSNITPIFSQAPKLGGGRHFGGRLVATDKHLYIAMGDRGNRDKAQQNDSHVGTLVRLNLDGSVPDDNPFLSDANAKPEIYSYGHRNIQGMTLDNDGKRLWTHEHGPQGGDEINLVEPGTNYGWPVITYGVNYGTGSKIGQGTTREGMAQPNYYWVPSIAPSGLEMVEGDQFREWQGDLLVGSLKFGLLVRLNMEDGQIVGEERLLNGKYGRIRDVVEAPDGKVYLLTDESNGKVLSLTPIF